MSTPELVGIVQCYCEYLARLQEFVIASFLSCAQGPQYLTGVCVCVRVCMSACIILSELRVCLCARVYVVYVYD